MNHSFALAIVLYLLLLFACSGEKSIEGTWVSGDIDSTFTIWDINKNEIISNEISDFKEIGKYRLLNSKLILDSGLVSCFGFSIPAPYTVEIDIEGDEFRIVFGNNIDPLEFRRVLNLSLSQQSFSESMLNVEVPRINYHNEFDYDFVSYIYAGKPKRKFLKSYGDYLFVQLNDVLVNPRDKIIQHFLGSNNRTDVKEATVLFFDKNVPMNFVDSVRRDFYGGYYFGVLDSGNNINYVRGLNQPVCSCVYPKPGPPLPYNFVCKHDLYLKSDKSDILQIDAKGQIKYKQQNYSLTDLMKLELSNSIGDEKILFFSYENETRFSDYLSIYAILHKGRKGRITELDEYDLQIVNSRSK